MNLGGLEALFKSHVSVYHSHGYIANHVNVVIARLKTCHLAAILTTKGSL